MENEIQTVEVGQIELLNRAEIDMQIATAKKYPRELEKFLSNAITLATQDVEIAASCNYRLERKQKDGGKKIIEGPSIRVAEIALSEYGNARAYGYVVSEGSEAVVAEAIFYDVEKNIAFKEQVSRRIVGKTGKRFSLDMVNITKNAAVSIALRNVILRGVPRAFVNKIAAEAKKVAIGNKATIKKRITLMFKKFEELAVTKEMIFKKINKSGISDINLADMEALLGLYAAISGGDATVEEQFAEERTSSKPDTTPTTPKEDPKKKPEPEETPQEETVISTEDFLSAITNMGKQFGLDTREKINGFLKEQLKFEKIEKVPEKSRSSVLDLFTFHAGEAKK